MRGALARHDALARAVVERAPWHGRQDDRRRLLRRIRRCGRRAATQRSRCNASSPTPRRPDGIGLRLRCGLHVGVVEHRDNDYFGRVVNRAARIMTAAHGGQVLLSQAVATLIGERLPADVGAARSRHRATARPSEPGARLPDRPSAAPVRLSGAACSGVRAEQPAAADNVLRRARARARRGPRIAAQHAAPDADRSRRPGQDAAVAATGGQRDGRVSRRRSGSSSSRR